MRLIKWYLGGLGTFKTKRKDTTEYQRIENILVYTHLIEFEEDSFIVKVATSTEFVELLEQGFLYVGDLGEEGTQEKEVNSPFF